jgi:hypothetical protein
MSLELINKLFKDWDDPHYKGFSGQLSKSKINVNNSFAFKMFIDAKNSKYTSIDTNKLESYKNNELLEFYAGHNIKPAYLITNSSSPYHGLLNTTYDIDFNYYLKYINPNSEYVLELGFASGFVSLLYLQNTISYVTCIDKMINDVHYYGKNFIDAKYPGRHTLLIGSPKHIKLNNVIFGSIHINKSRKFEHIYDYFAYYKNYSDENTIIILKNTTPHETWGLGSYMAMMKAISEGLLILLEHKPTDDNYYGSVSILKYNFEPNYTQHIHKEQFIQMEYKILYSEFVHFLNNETNSNLITQKKIDSFRTKFIKYGLDYDDQILSILKDKFNIII